MEFYIDQQNIVNQSILESAQDIIICSICTGVVIIPVNAPNAKIVSVSLVSVNGKQRATPAHLSARIIRLKSRHVLSEIFSAR